MAVLVTNQRTIEETYAAMTLIGGALGEPEAAARLVDDIRSEFAALREGASQLTRRPRVFFEEWDEPLISGIAWVSELIDLCGGEELFPELRSCQSAAQRIVDPAEVIRRDPEVIVASWCGKKARLERIAARPGWSEVSAMRAGRIYEIKAPDILQPGPSLVYGARQLAEMIAETATGVSGRP